MNSLSFWLPWKSRPFSSIPKNNFTGCSHLNLQFLSQYFQYLCHTLFPGLYSFCWEICWQPNGGSFVGYCCFSPGSLENSLSLTFHSFHIMRLREGHFALRCLVVLLVSCAWMSKFLPHVWEVLIHYFFEKALCPLLPLLRLGYPLSLCGPLWWSEMAFVEFFYFKKCYFSHLFHMIHF